MAVYATYKEPHITQDVIIQLGNMTLFILILLACHIAFEILLFLGRFSVDIFCYLKDRKNSNIIENKLSKFQSFIRREKTIITKPAEFDQLDDQTLKDKLGAKIVDIKKEDPD